MEEFEKDGTDLRSVHFLRFPTVRVEYFDPVIVRQMKRMQAVINLGRTIRERKTISLKVSLFLLTFFSSAGLRFSEEEAMTID